MSDIYLFPEEPNPADVRFREPSAPTALYTVEVAVTAIGQAAQTNVVTSGETPAIPSVPVHGSGPRPRPRPAPPVHPRRPVTHHVIVAGSCQGRVAVSMTVDHAGRRDLEDELVLLLI